MRKPPPRERLSKVVDPIRFEAGGSQPNSLPTSVLTNAKMHCSQNRSESGHAARRYIVVSVEAPARRARPGTGRAAARSAAAALPGAARLTLLSIKQLHTVLKRPSCGAPKAQSRSAALTVADVRVLSGRSPSTLILRTSPGNSAPGQSKRSRNVEAEERRDTEPFAALPCGRVAGSCTSANEINVSENIIEAPCLLLTLNEAARRLSVCRRTLERLIAAGEFPRPVKVAGSTRVPVADVEAYVARLTRGRGAA